MVKISQVLDSIQSPVLSHILLLLQLSQLPRPDHLLHTLDKDPHEASEHQEGKRDQYKPMTHVVHTLILSKWNIHRVEWLLVQRKQVAVWAWLLVISDHSDILQVRVVSEHSDTGVPRGEGEGEASDGETCLGFLFLELLVLSIVEGAFIEGMVLEVDGETCWGDVPEDSVCFGEADERLGDVDACEVSTAVLGCVCRVEQGLLGLVRSFESLFSFRL